MLLSEFAELRFNNSNQRRKTEMNFRKIKRNFKRDTKAISPVIATLLMIAIAVVASLVTYAWVMGYMNFTTEKVGKSIQSVTATGTALTVYVQNVGNSDLEIITAQGLYFNGALVGGPAATGTLLQGNTVVYSGTIAATTPGTVYTIKATSKDGTFSQVTKSFP
jgi:flagellin-like protein